MFELASDVIAMLVGAPVECAARRRNPRGNINCVLPLASGFIAGEAVVAILMAILISQGLLDPL